MISIDLSGKTILITGALGAIAEHMVRRLAASGATLVLTDIKPERQALADTERMEDSAFVLCLFSRRYHGFQPGSHRGARRLRKVSGYGHGHRPRRRLRTASFCRRPRKPNMSASSASIILPRLIWRVPCWRAGRERKIAGHLIFTSSYVARMPHTLIPSYSSAKAALENFARSLALEYALTGIRVNVVSPGNVAAGSSLKVFDEDPAYREFVLRVSLGRRNSPESIADAFVFLCSPLAAEINGQVLSPDYGAGIGNRL